MLAGRNQRGVRIAVAATLLVAGSCIAGYAWARAHAGVSPVLLDARGTCPIDPASVWTSRAHPAPTPLPLCRITKFGNVETTIFHIPNGAWGLTWAYRCPKPEDFYAVVHLPSLDGLLPQTSVIHHGRDGRGYQMETDNWQDTKSAVPAQWFNPQDVVVASTCSWHVRVVAGNASVVARYVPDIRGDT